VMITGDASYRVAARAHARGCAEDSGNGTWSTLVWFDGSCSPAATTPSAAVGSAGITGKDKPATHWLEVFRWAELGRELPDFLDNHDVGDAGGLAALVSVQAATSPTASLRMIGPPGRTPLSSAAPHPHPLFDVKAPMTRHCIEVANATVRNTTTTTQGAASVDGPYSDYRSTNAPWILDTYPIDSKMWMQHAEVTPGAEYASWCDLSADRNIGQLARDHQTCCDLNQSSPSVGLCDCCSAASAQASRRHVGMMPVGLPWYIGGPADGYYPEQKPPVGRWFSLPVGGRCPLGAHVGDGGCTWQRTPLSHSVYFEELAELGLNRTAFIKVYPPPPGAHQPPEQTLQNVAVFRAAWAKKGLPPCGAS